MYGLDWIERLRTRASIRTADRPLSRVSPVVWALGFTSLLTDVSAEMVTSVLPAYLVLHLNLSPMQYGMIDAVYNGFAVALLSLAAGFATDRLWRHKEVALAGYGLSAVCKLMLPAAGGAWGGIAAAVGLDRAGKGIRTAPRDALISLHTAPDMMATAFGVHRALDAAGALLGPIIALVLLWQLPRAFDVVWVASFTFAALGCAVLWLWVPARQTARPHARIWNLWANLARLTSRRFGSIVGCGLLLSATAVSDGFVYLLLQQRGETPAHFFPLFYIATACFYMLFAIPAGHVADRLGRAPTLLAGHVALGLIYCVLLVMQNVTLPVQIGCLALLGLYYAASEGVLVALASAAVPAEARTTGLAVVATAIGVGRMLSSLAFGWAWSTYGISQALFAFAVTLAVALAVATLWLRSPTLSENRV